MQAHDARDLLNASQIEHVDQLLADAYGMPLEPYSTAFVSAMRLYQLLLLDGAGVMLDADERMATARIGRDGVSVTATAPTAAEALSLAALAWARV